MCAPLAQKQSTREKRPDRTQLFVGALGVRFDSATGLHYCRQRWYDAAGLQRFLSRDPIGVEGGINLYAYCENSPIDAVDPSGTQLWPPDESGPPPTRNPGDPGYNPEWDSPPPPTNPFDTYGHPMEWTAARIPAPDWLYCWSECIQRHDPLCGKRPPVVPVKPTNPELTKYFLPKPIQAVVQNAPKIPGTRSTSLAHIIAGQYGGRAVTAATLGTFVYVTYGLYISAAEAHCLSRCLGTGGMWRDEPLKGRYK